MFGNTHIYHPYLVAAHEINLGIVETGYEIVPISDPKTDEPLVG